MANQEYKPMGTGKQLGLLIALMIGFSILGTLISMVVVAGIWDLSLMKNVIYMTNTSAPGFLGAFRILLGFGSSLMGFLAPALVFSYLVVQEPDEYIGLRNYTPAILLVLAAVIMAFCLPTIDITSYYNQKMALPPSMHGLDKWIHDMEKAGQAQVKLLMDMKTPADLLITLLLVAVFPAVAEEFFFRGCMQTIFKRMTGNIHAAVWITAFIFSFIHFEFLGFVPRMLLGAVLGYLYAWSGSIWPSVVVHFFNNGFSVVAVYLYQQKIITGDPDSNVPMFSQGWIYAVCLVVAILLLLLFRKITIDKQLLIADGEELD